MFSEQPGLHCWESFWHSWALFWPAPSDSTSCLLQSHRRIEGSDNVCLHSSLYPGYLQYSSLLLCSLPSSGAGPFQLLPLGILQRRGRSLFPPATFCVRKTADAGEESYWLHTHTGLYSIMCLVKGNTNQTYVPILNKNHWIAHFKVENFF